MNSILSTRSRIFILLALLVSTVALTVFSPKIAHANYFDLDNYLSIPYDQYVSNEENDPVTGRGNKTPRLRFLFYTDENAPSDFVIIQNVTVTGKPRCGDFDISINNLPDDAPRSGRDNFGTPIGVTEGDTDKCRTTSDGNGFIIRDLASYNKFRPSVRFPGKAVIAIELRLKTTSSSKFVDADVSFNGNNRLSHIGSYTNPPVDADGVSYSRWQAGYGNIVADFAPPCDYNGPGTVNIHWKDADSREDANGGPSQPVTYRMEMKNAPTTSQPNPPWRQIRSGDAGSGGDIKNRSFPAVAGAKYRMIFENVRGRGSSNPANTVKVWYPFDQAAAFVPCPPKTAGGNAVCQRFGALPDRYKLQPHSRYRFSYYPNSNPGTLGNWATTSGSYIRNDASLFWSGNDGWSAVDYQTNSTNSTEDYYYDYPPPSSDGWIVKVERWEHTERRDSPSPTWDGQEWEYHHDSYQVNGCYVAPCTVSVGASLGGRPNSAGANTNIGLSVDVTNTGLADMNNITVNIGSNPGGIGYSTSFPLASGDPTSVDPGLLAPDDINSRTITASLNYGAVNLGSCSTSLDTYREYDVGAIARINSADNENPTVINYTAGGSAFIRNPGVNVVIPTQANIVRQNEDGTYSGSLDTLVNGSPTYAPWTQTANSTAVNRTLIPPGAFYCVRTVLAPGHGWVGPPVSGGTSSNIIAIENRQDERCERVVNKPYVRFYGQDVFAGGNFPNDTQTNGGIDANYRATGVGSGVEYAAFALGGIDRFASNNMKTDGAFDLLNFASTPTKGNFGAEHIATDYFANMPLNVRTLPATGSVDISSVNNESVYYNGDVSIDASSPLAPGTSRTLFVDGDVVIRNNIAYTNWGTDINAIPNFRLFVKGNIYIASNVGQIDGLLVAQPTDDPNTGQLHTCTKPDGSPASLTIRGTASNNSNPADPNYGECSGKLTINGAVVAQKVKWLRTFRTLSDALSGGLEPYNGTNASELINASSELYFGRPADPPTGGGTSGKYDSYQALPPIL